MWTDTNETNQYLTFKLGDDSYGVEITKVREVLDYTVTTKIPRTPEFMVGVINLRGSIVPVIDLRQTLEMPPSELGPDSCVIIIEFNTDKETLVVGALADSVQEVLDLSSSAIGAPPKLGTKLKTEFLKGIGNRGDSFILILDMDKVLSADELGAVEAASMSVLPEEMFALSEEDLPTPEL